MVRCGHPGVPAALRAPHDTQLLRVDGQFPQHPGDHVLKIEDFPRAHVKRQPIRTPLAPNAVADDQVAVPRISPAQAKCRGLAARITMSVNQQDARPTALRRLALRGTYGCIQTNTIVHHHMGFTFINAHQHLLTENRPWTSSQFPVPSSQFPVPSSQFPMKGIRPRYACCTSISSL